MIQEEFIKNPPRIGVYKSIIYFDQNKIEQFMSKQFVEELNKLRTPNEEGVCATLSNFGYLDLIFQYLIKQHKDIKLFDSFGFIHGTLNNNEFIIFELGNYFYPIDEFNEIRKLGFIFYSLTKEIPLAFLELIKSIVGEKVIVDFSLNKSYLSMDTFYMLPPILKNLMDYHIEPDGGDIQINKDTEFSKKILKIINKEVLENILTNYHSLNYRLVILLISIEIESLLTLIYENGFNKESSKGITLGDF